MERWAGLRVYGSDDGEPAGPVPGRVYVELVGGPLDGQLLDVTSWGEDERADGALLVSDQGQWGPGGRSDYAPVPGDPVRFLWVGDTP
ncbi:hypothetical protein AB0D54_38740 [Streptomyces xanthophaeus]|uniref:hypothetical protein n=1 Tax=Streptomyces xanthophaeus TaxID=67385 RepID=UPI003431DD96